MGSESGSQPGAGRRGKFEGVAGGHLSTSVLRQRFPGAFDARPAVYWADLIGTAALGWGAFALAVSLPPGSALHLLAFSVAVLALYRALLFIHEVAHFRRGMVPGFETVWNLIMGLPLMAPSLMYVGSHADHHRRALFGTREDPEYEAIAHWSRLRIFSSFLTMLLVPGMVALRFGILGPLSLLSPTLRRLVVERASTLVINPAYRRRAPRGHDARRWALEETGAALLFWGVAAGLLTGRIPISVPLHWYAASTAILVLNHARTLVAHRYENEGNPLDGVGQLLDSVNLRGLGVTALVAPVGLRYHALHHLAPAIPYHNLGSIHRALLAELPADAPYLVAQEPGVLIGFLDLLGRSRRNRARLDQDQAA